MNLCRCQAFREPQNLIKLLRNCEPTRMVNETPKLAMRHVRKIFVKNTRLGVPYFVIRKLWRNHSGSRRIDVAIKQPYLNKCSTLRERRGPIETQWNRQSAMFVYIAPLGTHLNRCQIFRKLLRIRELWRN